MTPEQKQHLVNAAMMANHISRELGDGFRKPDTYYELTQDSINCLKREFDKYAAICRELEQK